MVQRMTKEREPKKPEPEVDPNVKARFANLKMPWNEGAYHRTSAR